jgi:hypothetical protein
VYRAVVLTTLTLLLLAITGITLARESTFGPAGDSLAEPTVQDATTTGEPTATTVRESTEGKIANVGKPKGVGKAKGFGGKAEGSGGDRVDEGEARDAGHQEKVTLCHKGKNTIAVGAPAQAAHVRHGDTVGLCQTEEAAPGPPEETPGGAAQNGDGGAGNGQQKVMLCHKGKTLTIGAPAQAAHLRHGDTEGPCAGQ